jgi:hypothetical protein
VLPCSFPKSASDLTFCARRFGTLRKTLIWHQALWHPRENSHLVPGFPFKIGFKMQKNLPSRKFIFHTRLKAQTSGFFNKFSLW